MNKMAVAEVLGEVSSESPKQKIYILLAIAGIIIVALVMSMFIHWVWNKVELGAYVRRIKEFQDAVITINITGSGVVMKDDIVKEMALGSSEVREVALQIQRDRERILEAYIRSAEKYRDKRLKKISNDEKKKREIEKCSRAIDIAREMAIVRNNSEDIKVTTIREVLSTEHVCVDVYTQSVSARVDELIAGSGTEEDSKDFVYKLEYLGQEQKSNGTLYYRFKCKLLKSDAVKQCKDQA
jgi:hypothetical protein